MDTLFVQTMQQFTQQESFFRYDCANLLVWSLWDQSWKTCGSVFLMTAILASIPVRIAIRRFRATANLPLVPSRLGVTVYVLIALLAAIGASIFAFA